LSFTTEGSIVLKIPFWKRFVKSNKGSVSVYLIVILVPIFLFHAVLIDYARVMLAERESEMAVKSGLRSVLAGFDLELQPYGLFALKNDIERASLTFGDIIKQNITPTQTGKYIQLLKEQLNEKAYSLKSVYTLANQTVLHHQILEDMKYIAPLEYTLELTKKFNKTEVISQLNASKQFSENADKLESLLDQRNQTLDDVWSHSSELLNQAEAMNLNYNQQLKEAQSIQSIESIKASISLDYSELINKFNTILLHIKEAEETNTLLNNEKQRLSASAGSNLDSTNSYKFILIYDVNYFSLYRSELSKTIAGFSGLKTILVNRNTNDNSFYEVWMQASNGFIQQIHGFKLTQGDLEDHRQQDYSQKKLKKNQQKNKLNQSLAAAKNAGQGCEMANEASFSHSYKELNGDITNPKEGLYAKYQSYNLNSNEIMENDQKLEMDTTEAALQNSLKWIEQFTGKTAAFRDELYLDEYVLSSFSYRTQDIKEQTANRFLRNQEVEYILYGLGSCSANFAAAYSEMYIMLLAIRTMEALLKPQNELLNIGSPLLVFLAAAAQGSANALTDMSKLLKGGVISIMQKTPNLTVNYKQLLRIFLVLHHNEERMMSRLQALIELETGTPLEKKATYIQGTANISLQLWFIPAFFKSLNLAGLSKCTIVKNRCEIKRTAVIAY
jgi:hypothetical protein